MKCLTAAEFALALAMGLPPAAEPCTCILQGTPETLLRDRGLVLVVRVTAVDRIPPRAELADLPEQYWPQRVTFAAEHVWKGTGQPEYSAVTNAAWDTCGYSFVLEQRYVVYSSEGSIPATLCDHIYRLDRASDHVRYLDKATGRKMKPPAR
jgi:hypothetical protein